MQLRHFTCGAAAMTAIFLFSLLTTTNAHNITRILAKHPEYSTFNKYLTLTHLASEINSRTTITVLAVSNPDMQSLLSKHLSLHTLKNVLSLHVLLDFFGPKKLHQITNGTALAATLFQATGSAPGSTGFVNVTDLKGGKVGFTAEGHGGDFGVFFVKSVEELKYNISVIGVNGVLNSEVAEAPTPEPSKVNITHVMSAHGCKVFADTLLANPQALKVYQDSVDGGLTVFCPMDDPFKAFLPRFKNLTAGGKESLLEFFGVPIYQSMPMLKSNNGLMNTLATDGANKFDLTVQNDGEAVTLKTRINTARITGTLLDEEPLAIYTIDKVLLPKELFKKDLAATPSPAPAPAPEPAAADAPKPPKKKGHHPPADVDADEESPAPSPDDEAADQTADDNSAMRFKTGRFGFMALSLCVGVLQLL